MRVVVPAVLKSVVRPGEASRGKIQPTIWATKVGNWGHLTQSVAQRPFTSEVQATERPRPYCHWARMGSPCGEVIIRSALGLRVDPLYPSNLGRVAVSRPFTIGLDFTISGLK